jgi:hypothetical protein
MVGVLCVVAEITSLVVPPYAVVFGNNLKWYAVAAVNPVIVCSFRDESAKLPTNEANVPSRSHSKSTNSNVPFHETTTAELSITVPTTDEMGRV